MKKIDHFIGGQAGPGPLGPVRARLRPLRGRADGRGGACLVRRGGRRRNHRGRRGGGMVGQLIEQLGRRRCSASVSWSIVIGPSSRP